MDQTPVIHTISAYAEMIEKLTLRRIAKVARVPVCGSCVDFAPANLLAILIGDIGGAP